MAQLAGALRERQRHAGVHGRPPVSRMHSHGSQRAQNSSMATLVLAVARWVESATGAAHRVSEDAVYRMSRRAFPRNNVSAEWIQEAREHVLNDKTERLTREDILNKFSDH